MFSGYLLCDWLCAWVVGTVEDVPAALCSSILMGKMDIQQERKQLEYTSNMIHSVKDKLREHSTEPVRAWK